MGINEFQTINIQNDGNADSFTQDQQVEALFENTGLSRYFMRNFATDIFEWRKPEEFMQNEWLNENERDRGIIRRQRIYRRLLLSAGIYRENDELNDDFLIYEITVKGFKMISISFFHVIYKFINLVPILF